MSIPKMFHKIWFGNKPDQLNYSQDWLKHFPDYKLIEWDNKTIIPYIKEMINLLGCVPKCSFNFVSDVVRLLAIRDYGGIYLDHDVEIFKNFEHVLKDSDTFLTFQYPTCDNPPRFKLGTKMSDVLIRRNNLNGLYEGEYNSKLFINSDDYINACFIASKPNSSIITRAIELYIQNFIAPDNLKYGLSDWGFGPQVLSHSALEHGIILNGKTQKNSSVTVFERSFFHPLHGVERLNSKKEYFEKLEYFRNRAFTFHHHSFTNLKEYNDSIGTENFNKVAYEFTDWYNSNIEFSESL